MSVSTSRESGNLRHPNYADKIYFDHVLRTRADTWSNFAYVPVSFYGLAFGWRDLPPAARRTDWLSRANPRAQFSLRRES